MEGLAFPLCLLRCLLGTYCTAAAHDASPNPSYELIEGVVSVLLTKHVRHKGLGKGPEEAEGVEGGPQQQQQVVLMSPTSPSAIHEVQSGFLAPGP